MPHPNDEAANRMTLPQWIVWYASGGNDRASKEDSGADLSAAQPGTVRSAHPGAADEAALVERVRVGDIGAFEQLFRAHYPQLVAFAMSVVRSRAAAEDVVQDVLFRTWERRTTLCPERGVRPYLFAAVRNRATDALRSTSHARRVAAELFAEHDERDAEASDIDDVDAELQARVALVQDAIAGLNATSREILALRAQGLTFAEIGEALGMPLKTVATRAARAVGRIRQALATRK